MLGKIGVTPHYQNAVDQLTVLAAMKQWTKLGENKYKTQTGYIVSVEIAPELILTNETYLFPEETNEAEVPPTTTS